MPRADEMADAGADGYTDGEGDMPHDDRCGCQDGLGCEMESADVGRAKGDNLKGGPFAKVDC